MIKPENTEVIGWKAAIRGIRAIVFTELIVAI